MKTKIKTDGMVLPNFLIIGAARSGTTSLYYFAKSHPEIYLPEKPRPEPHFFLKPNEYEKGLDYYSQNYFSDWEGEDAVGEKSASYLLGEDVPLRIYNDLSDVKFVVIIRDPIDRAYSNFWITKENGLEERSFDEAVRMEKERKENPKNDFERVVQPYSYIERGLYYRQIKRYLSFFKKNDFLILIFKNLVNNPKSLVEKLYQFLEVDQNHKPDNLHRKRNSTSEKPPIKKKTIRFLREKFQKDSRKLLREFQIDITHWKVFD